MKNLDLSTYGVVELTQQEMIAVEGGSWIGNLLTGLVNFLLEVEDLLDTIRRRYF